MATFLLSGKSFDISSTSKDFLESYIKRIKSYIELHDISETYLDDINERIIEKLAQLQKDGTETKDIDIIKIVNDIGEPEDIFPENEILSTPKDTKKSDLFKKPFERNTEKGIIFGVCAGMADYFEVDALWIRLLFIFFTATWGAGIIVYIALAILLPSKTKIVKEGQFQERRGIIDQLAGLVGGSFRGIFRLFLIIIFGSIGLGLIGCFMGGVVVSGFLLSGSFEIGNQYFPSIIPQSLLIGAPLLTILSLVVVIAIFASILGKDLLGKIGWIIVTLLSGAGFVLLATGGFTLLHEYTWTENKTQEQSFDFTGTTLQIEDLMNHRYSQNIEFQNVWNDVSIQKETGRKIISIRSITSIQSKDSTAGKEIMNKIIQPIYTLSGNILKLESTEGGDFSSRVPFSFPRRSIQIIVPENVTITGEFYYYNPEDEYLNDDNGPKEKRN